LRRFLAALALGSLVLLLTSSYWLGAAGAFLVSASEPAPSDGILVLAGDSDGNRIRRAAEIAKAGFAPKVYMSGPRPIYGVSEAVLAINEAVREGFEARLFEALDMPSSSTEEEAHVLVPLLRQRGVKTLMVVTSNYHTRRAGRIWRAAAPEMSIRMVAAKDSFFSPGAWWKSRNGRKVAFYEWVKTLTAPLGA
jgi:uncharacterized SAM-binding protein YcdF (DUF218 family)